MDPMTITPHLETLQEAGLLRLAQADPEPEYIFQHTLMQETIYESLLKEDRVRLHRLAGETLERLYPDQVTSRDLAPVLGHHFAEAGDDDRALKYFTLAGDVDAGLYANTEAVTHYRRAIEIAQRLDDISTERLIHLYSRCGRALELSAHYDEALTLYQDMETLAHDQANQTLELSALTAQATILSTVTPVYDPEQGEALAERALTLAHTLNDQQAEAKVLWIFMLLYQSMEQFRPAIEYGQRSLALARALNLREQLAFTLNDLQYSYMSIGHLSEGLAALNEAQQLWRELGNLPMLTDNLSRLALAYYLNGRFDQALQVAEEASLISQTINNVWGQGFSRFTLGPIYLELGQPGLALEKLEETLFFAGESKLRSPFALVVQADQAWLYGCLGAVERGVALIHAAIATVGDEQSRPNFLPLLNAVLCRLELLRGNLRAAESAFAAAEAALNKEQPLSFTLVWVAVARAELAIAQTDYEEAVELLTEFIERGQQLGLRTFLPEAMWLKSLALLGLEQEMEAITLLVAARQEAEALDFRRTLWPILASLSRIKAQQGHQAEAEDLHRQAVHIIEAIAAHIDQPHLRETFLGLPAVQAVL